MGKSELGVRRTPARAAIQLQTMQKRIRICNISPSGAPLGTPEVCMYFPLAENGSDRVRIPRGLTGSGHPATKRGDESWCPTGSAHPPRNKPRQDRGQKQPDRIGTDAAIRSGHRQSRDKPEKQIDMEQNIRQGRDNVKFVFAM